MAVSGAESFCVSLFRRTAVIVRVRVCSARSCAGLTQGDFEHSRHRVVVLGLRMYGGTEARDRIVQSLQVGCMSLADPRSRTTRTNRDSACRPVEHRHECLLELLPEFAVGPGAGLNGTPEQLQQVIRDRAFFGLRTCPLVSHRSATEKSCDDAPSSRSSGRAREESLWQSRADSHPPRRRRGEL